ncbi:MAG TPA: hypothetical protein VNS79_09245 [Sphingobium sp.]|nr:hypothetical protein [Sphingobium sp.]
MDRRNAYRLLIAVAALATAAAVARTAALPLSEARWIAPGHDVARALTTEPRECLALPADPDARLAVEIGRAAFRDPLVLGGVAARVGLACASCHRAGHANPDFHFPGLSGAPGTADTTSAITSERRDDGQFNPRPIPSLVTDAGDETISRTRTGALEQFIHGLIVEEFDGPEPAPGLLAGLAAYVRALRSEACHGPGNGPIMVTDRINDIARALDAGARALALGDRASARAMMSSARSMLGALVERLPAPDLAPARVELRAMAIEIGRLQAGPVSAADLTGLRRRLLGKQAAASTWQTSSLFDAGTVETLLGHP